MAKRQANIGFEEQKLEYIFNDSGEENQMLFWQICLLFEFGMEMSIIDGDLWKQTLLTSCLFIGKSKLVAVLRYSRN